MVAGLVVLGALGLLFLASPVNCELVFYITTLYHQHVAKSQYDFDTLLTDPQSTHHISERTRA